MKTVEQKAKAYDEALERMKSWVRGEHPECFTEAQKTAEFIFPELKESEDERIRKDIIEMLRNWASVHYITKEQFSERMAWLEKHEQKPADKVVPRFKVGDTMRTLQEANDGYTDGMPVVISIDNEYYHCTNELIAIKDQDDYEFPPINVKRKSADKVEPEFHEGEWVVYNHDICQIVKREEGCNKLVTVFGIEKELVNERNLSTAHLWTIQDAKDGDVLACNGEILLFKSYSVQGRISLYCWYNGQTNNFHNKEVVDVLLTTRNKVCPATKEQRDLLFQTMKDAGYEWDADKKELNKIEDEPENYKQQLMSEITDLVEDYISQKPTWTEEDTKKLYDILPILGGGENCFYNSPILIDWLKSLKERIGG